MSSISDSFWKPPLLKPGQFDWWKDQFEAHVCSLDGQLWSIFESGPLTIPPDTSDPEKPVEKTKDQYTDEDYKKLEKNARAKKVIYMALSPGDQIKVAMYKTAKDMYDGLVRLYGGNEDIKRNRILAAIKDYESVVQRKDESLEDFYTRFQVIIGQLEYLNEKLPEWKITHQFMQALNSKWDHVTLALQAQKGIKDITLEELVANLQSQAGITERKMARRQSEKSQAIALKVEKALDLSHGNGSPKEDDEIALLTKALNQANFGKGRRDFRAGGSRGKFSKWNKGAASNEDKGKSKEKEDRICYHCQKKGHLSADCYSRKKGEEPAPKPTHAMFVAWGDSDSDDGKCIKEPCLMAHSASNQVTDTDSFIDEVFSESDFAETITKLLEKIQRMENRISSMQQEHHADIEENNLWANKAMRLEKEIAEHVCKCLTCARKERQISKLSEELERMTIGNTEMTDFNTKVEELERELANHKQNNEELLHIVAELRSDEAAKKEKWLRELEAKRIEDEKDEFKRTFVRPGLGYEEGKEAKEKDTKGKKVMMEQGEGSCQNRGSQNIGKTRRETSPQDGFNVHDKDSVPYKARKAYEIWLKMSQRCKS
ncbi:unnamed protein product [Rhodiola kirilowii]